MISYDTQDVVISKRVSAEWAAATFPLWSSLIAAANKSYARQATPQDQELLASRVADFFDFACDRIQKSQRERTTSESEP